MTARPDGSVRLVTDADGPVVLLDRPHRRNALTLPMWRDLGDLVARHGADPDAGPLRIAGAGGYLCSGADLGALAHARSTPEAAREFVGTVVRTLLTIHTAPREVVAVVEGGAAGGGVEIMAAAHRSVSVGEPTLVFPFGHHGMTLDDLTLTRLHALVGAQETRRLTDGRHVVAAAEARRLGLLDGPSSRTDYARPGESPQETVDRAAAPMLAALSP